MSAGIPDPGRASGVFAALERTEPELVTEVDGVAVTTSLVIAQGTGNEHASVMRLIRNNLHDFMEFGRVGFEIRPFATAGGTQRREVAVLTEQHATLLLTYMRNSDVVRSFKKQLVRAFFAMRDGGFAAMVPKSLPDALRAYAREVEARQAAEAYAKELEPKADYVDNFVSPDDCTLFRNIANQVGMQEKALRELLTEKRWIYRHHIGRRYSRKAGKLVDEYEWRAYADHRNHFRLFPQHNAPRHHNNQVRQTLYVTPPGAQAIRALVNTVGAVE